MSRSGILTPPVTGDTFIPFSRPGTPGSVASVLEPKIAFVGLGNLGSVMARNLASYRATHIPDVSPLLVWNRTVEKSELLVKEVGGTKVHIAQNLEEIVEFADVVIVNLANDAAVEQVYKIFEKALAASPPSKTKLFVETSTIYPALAGDLDKLITVHPHTHLITAPVFGTPRAAAGGQLLVAMSGDYYFGKKQVAYILVPSVARKVIDLGANLEKAPTFKLIGNSMILGVIEALSESFTLAHKVGIDSDTVLDFVKEVLPAPSTVVYAERFAHDRFDATDGFAIDGGIKDAALIRRLTNEHNAPMPTIDIAHQHLLTARAINERRLREGTNNAIPNLDWSGLIAASRVGAALEPFDSHKHANLVVEEDP